MQDDLKAMFKVCHHIKSNGIRCGSPAVSGMNFCFHHIGGRPMAFVRAHTTSTYATNLPLAYPGTREAIQHNLALLAQALNQGQLDPATANAYIRLYRVAEQNLTRWEKTNRANRAAESTPDAGQTTNPEMLPLSAEELQAETALIENAEMEERVPGMPNECEAGGATPIAEPRALTPESSAPHPESTPQLSSRPQLPQSGNAAEGPALPHPDPDCALRETAPSESALPENEILAAQHAARCGRPLNTLERAYFGLIPQP